MTLVSDSVVDVSGRPEVQWGIPSLFEPVARRPRRYKIVYGGRGSGKSMNVATIVVGKMMQRLPIMGQPFRVLCGREYQNSISDSVHFEIVGAIHRLGVEHLFKINNASVVCRLTGAQIIYRGLHNNVDQIKSLGGIDLFWGEEAHSFTEDSLIYIDPTIRRDAPFGPCGEGSELWFTLNQHLDTDPIYVQYKLAQGAWEDQDTMVIPCTWKDNPYFPKVLERQRMLSEQHDPRDHYEWVWGTQCRNMGGIFFALENLLIRSEPIDWPPLCDTVFAVIDSATKTGNEHDGTAVLYCALNKHGTGFPLILLDYDYMQIQGSLLEQWLPSVYKQLGDMALRCHARFPSPGVFIEDKASGMILLQQARRRDMNAHAIDSKLTALGKTERAINASGYVHRGMVKITKPCFDRVVQFKGVTLNHLLSQIKAFRVGDEEARDKADDLLDCFDAMTEVLTDKGWRRFADLDRTETIATVNLPTDTIEYQKPSAYIERDHCGEMVCIKGKRIDICVTPNHRMIVESNDAIWRGEYRPRIELAGELKAAHILKNTSNWIGSRDQVVIASWVYEGAKGPALDKKIIDRGLMAEFVGWFVAEGSRSDYTLGTSRRRSVIISQMPGAKAVEIEDILGRLPFKYHRSVTAQGCYNFRITSAQLHDFLNDCYVPGSERPCYRKRIPQWVLDSSPDILERFFAAMVKGDGWEQSGHRTVATTSKTLADQLQECLIKIA